MESRDTIKKQTRMVEHDRQKYQAAVKQQLQKQSDTISALRKENEKLKQEVASTTGGSYKFSDQDASSQLQQEAEALERKLNYEKMRQRDLDKKLTVARMDLTRARRAMNGVNVTQDNIQLIEKQVRVLENRLDQALVQFNEALAYNRELRQQIDNLRGERKVFTDIYRKLESDLHDKKKKMAQIIEESNKDYEARDALKEQLETLRAAAREDSKKYDEHFARLDEMMLKYKQLKEQQQQQALQQQQQQQQQQQAQKSPTKGKSDEASRKEESRKKTQPETQVAIADEQNADDEEGDLQQVIDKLKAGTGIQELELLHQKFVKSEEQSFSLYNFVNELKVEEEKLEQEIAVLQEQYHKQRGDTSRSAALKALENELAVTETQHEALSAKTSKRRETLEQVRKDTQQVFDKIGCSKQMAEDLVGTTEVNELNLLTFLGIIEHRANELLFASNLAAAQETKKRAAGKDEEARRRREQKEAERQARRDAGEVADDDDLEDDEAEDSGPTGETRARFVGVGPSAARGAVSAKALVMKEVLPTTTATDPNNEEDNNNDTPAIVDHNQLRLEAEERLKVKREAKKNRGRKK
eukprot:CAMPEP_0174852078 /NCGR_PEP_ID=MMETSP1114-20130205/25169_1 /TAXON_ID=312471 /ORGANISM="Neobodo designis, Strain CCAP 1951/1" /LENGTH=584 /DNA_ID=CAMNT_0016086655 /DNA_START=36 /DNA_END=1790 /DNA_ORIENTATION=-